MQKLFEVAIVGVADSGSVEIVVNESPKLVAAESEEDAIAKVLDRGGIVAGDYIPRVIARPFGGRCHTRWPDLHPNDRTRSLDPEVG